jgi:hypothetical protein
MTNDLRNTLPVEMGTSDLLIDGSSYSFIRTAIPLSSLRFRGFNTTASITISDHHSCHGNNNMSLSSYVSTKDDYMLIF